MMKNKYPRNLLTIILWFTCFSQVFAKEQPNAKFLATARIYKQTGQKNKAAEFYEKAEKTFLTLCAQRIFIRLLDTNDQNIQENIKTKIDPRLAAASHNTTIK